MTIKMIGIDFQNASLKERELFAFSPSKLRQALNHIYQNQQINGCVILSTCNRTELWVSEPKKQSGRLLEMLCREKAVDKKQVEQFFAFRKDHDAIRHLFQTAGGLRSQIIGEDQILSQVKQSIETAREEKTADECLEKLFQCAITAGKKIKNDVRITTADASVAHAALVRAEQKFGTVKDKSCLVIGNGEMGRLTAELFAKSGAKVFITKRNHKNAASVIPRDCISVDYEDRIETSKQCDIIVSATLSPHHTVVKEDFAFLPHISKPFLFLDLAVPRDIDERIQDFENVELADVDSIGIQLTINPNALKQANTIINSAKKDFYQWYLIRKYLSAKTAESIETSLKKELEALDLSQTEKVCLEASVRKVLHKAI